MELKSLNRIDLASLRVWFNTSVESIRIISLLYPNAPSSRSVLDSLRLIFTTYDSQFVKSFIILLPGMESQHEAEPGSVVTGLRDNRVSIAKDQDMNVAEVFREVLSLGRIACNVCMLYSPRLSWDSRRPPAPTFWMRQLRLDSGADQSLQVEQKQLVEEVKLMMDMEDPKSSDREVWRVLLDKEKRIS